MLAAERRRFVDDYLRIRRAEGRGSNDPAYYWELPYRDLTGRLSAQWEMRGRTYRYFERNVLSRMEREASRPLDLLDLGAGTGWMSYRLALRGHHPVAMDLLNDDWDGLGAARHFFTKLPREFARMQAEFDQLPFSSGRFDAVIYNASIHYSSDYSKTLAEARRVLRPSGRIVVLDSPVYKLREHGEMMRREKHAQFLAQFGTESDHVGSIEYLDVPMLDAISRQLNVAWRIHRPWYGLAWHSRPWKARLTGARPPSRFWILEGRLKP
jgi:ubiquinone/menaquinone biosynthesis C-methylase UbiE